MKNIVPIGLLVVLAVVGFVVFSKPNDTQKDPPPTKKKTVVNTDSFQKFVSPTPLPDGKDIKDILAGSFINKTVVATGGIGDIFKGRASFRLLCPDLMKSCEEANPELPWVP